MTLKIKGKKLGMTQFFKENGHVVACTVIEAQPNVVTQLKTVDRDGYEAVQLSFDKAKGKDPRTRQRRVNKPQREKFTQLNIEPHKHAVETRVVSTEGFEVGQEIGVGQFEGGDFVDVTAQSKGKGFQGVQKRYNFCGGPGAHGSGFHRAPGSIGMRSTPGRVFPGKKMPGRMGGEQVTVESLEVMQVVEGDNLILVKGAIPGPQGAWVTLRMSKKRKKRS